MLDVRVAERVREHPPAAREREDVARDDVVERQDAREEARDEEHRDDVPADRARYCSVVVVRIVPAFAVAFSTIVLSPLAVMSTQLERV